MKRYARCFQSLAAAGRGAFIPFTVLGFPDPTRCADQLDLLARNADALELAIPFSDPVADGPTIQSAAATALRAGATPRLCLDLVAGLRQSYPALPIGLLMYANLVLHPGVQRFYEDAAAAGVDSVLVADLPSEEGEPFAATARAAGVAPIFIAPPNADSRALDRIAQLGAGYTYVLTRSGVTGAERVAGRPAGSLLATLAKRGAPPAVLGFGISTPEHVSTGIAAGAAGVISGSAVVTRLQSLSAGRTGEEAVREWLAGMRSAAAYRTR